MALLIVAHLPGQRALAQDNPATPVATPADSPALAQDNVAPPAVAPVDSQALPPDYAAPPAAPPVESQALAPDYAAPPAAPPAESEFPPDPDLTWRPTKHVWFRPGGVIQARYTFNHRSELSGEPANTSRFSVPRARIILDSGVTEYLQFRVRLGVLSNGNARFEQAFASANLNEHFTLLAGILFLNPSIGDAASPEDLQGIDYSQYGLQTSGGNAAAAGGRVTFDRIRAQAFFSNGLRTGFSEFAEPIDARLAVTGRVEARLFTQDNFGRFDTESSFRGSDLALRVGAAAHYQQGRIDGTLPNGDLEQYTADVTLEGPGFNLIVAGRLLRVHPDEGNTTHDPGLLVQGGVFVHERIELWARYDALFSDGQVHSFPDNRNGLRDDYQAVVAGINGYLLPRSNRAKVQADFTYVPDPISTTWAEASDNAATLATSRDSQWSLRTQLVLAY